MVIAGEVSGDLIGAALIKELRKLNPELANYGIGGNMMRSQGINILYHINRMAFLGFVEVIRHLPFIKKVQADLITSAKDNKIKNVVLIDYPGFNLSIAKKFKKIGMNIIYYVSPQLWAWAPGRMKKIAKLVNKMIVVFPFEEKLYRDNNIDVEFVGHPLVERIHEYTFLNREELYQRFQIDKDKDILLLMPGSRKHEVAKIFPDIISAADILAKKYNMQIVVSCSSNIDEKLFEKMSNVKRFKVVKGHNYDLMKHAKFGIIKSGTSTLEAGYFALPMIVVYKTSLATYLIGKALINVKRLGMVNILLDDDVVPELIQSEVCEKSILKAANNILGNEQQCKLIREKLGDVRIRLGNVGASSRAAKIIFDSMNEN